jgi:hypothetical protein
MIMLQIVLVSIALNYFQDNYFDICTIQYAGILLQCCMTLPELCKYFKFHKHVCFELPPLWSSGQSSWL